MRHRDAEALLSCVRVSLGTASANQAREHLRRDVQWDAVETVALQHGVMPLLCRGLTAIGWDAVPASTRTPLQASFRNNAHRNLLLLQELRNVVASFESGGVRTMPLKGPLWGLSLYGDVALRQGNDLDLLIAPTDVTRAVRLLESVGYRARAPEATSVVAVRTWGLASVVVDLQWSLADAHYRFPMDAQLWDRVVSRTIAGTTAWHPSPSDQLRMLSGHAAKHAWSRLGWICDIAAFMQQHGESLDWQRTLAEARRCGGERILLVGLRLAASLLHVEIPSGVSQDLARDRVSASLAAKIREHLLQTPLERGRLNGGHGFVEAAFLYMRGRERVADKLPHLRYVAGMLLRLCTFRPNDLDRAVVPLPRAFSLLYYAVRPWRLTAKYGRLAVVRGCQAMTVWR